MTHLVDIHQTTREALFNDDELTLEAQIHIDSCDACRELKATLDRIGRIERLLPPIPEPPPELREKILRRTSGPIWLSRLRCWRHSLARRLPWRRI